MRPSRSACCGLRGIGGGRPPVADSIGEAAGVLAAVARTAASLALEPVGAAKGLEAAAEGEAPHEQVTPGTCGGLRTAEFDIARTTQKQHVGAEYAVFSDALTVPGIDLMKRGDSRWIASQAPA
jgi:hypothetical protein